MEVTTTHFKKEGVVMEVNYYNTKNERGQNRSFKIHKSEKPCTCADLLMWQACLKEES